MGLEEFKVDSADDNIKYFKCEGKIIAITIDDCHVNVDEVEWDEEEDDYISSKDLGSMDFKELENGNYYILDLALRRCRKKGIGREVLKFFKEYTKAKIYAHDGKDERLDDGSELIMDGPGFVSKMREEGIVEPIIEESEGPPDDFEYQEDE